MPPKGKGAVVGDSQEHRVLIQFQLVTIQDNCRAPIRFFAVVGEEADLTFRWIQG